MKTLSCLVLSLILSASAFAQIDYKPNLPLAFSKLDKDFHISGEPSMMSEVEPCALKMTNQCAFTETTLSAALDSIKKHNPTVAANLETAIAKIKSENKNVVFVGHAFGDKVKKVEGAFLKSGYLVNEAEYSAYNYGKRLTDQVTKLGDELPLSKLSESTRVAYLLESAIRAQYSTACFRAPQIARWITELALTGVSTENLKLNIKNLVQFQNSTGVSMNLQSEPQIKTQVIDSDGPAPK